VRLCTFQAAQGPRPGVVDGDLILPLGNASADAVIDGESTWARDAPPVPVGGAELIAPHRPRTVLGIGLNYRAHAAETGREPPAEPMVFAKLPGAVAAPWGRIPRPAYTRELDYEGELAVVIGAEARNVAVADVAEHVFGYAVMNDVSARDRQREEPRWIRAKGGDGFAPFGPWITTADEVPDPQDLSIRTWVNGELRQDGSTADMIFSVAELVSWCSHQFTLHPGDVIATGTPAGVGAGFDPPRYLQPGDLVRVEIAGLGHLEHEIAEGS
jgi:2-keto-4-pentenoate hydratase/2-oxohepta-3-ene-1,7-dioic acid hydratase in catechol pathway